MSRGFHTFKSGVLYFLEIGQVSSIPENRTRLERVVEDAPIPMDPTAATRVAMLDLCDALEERERGGPIITEVFGLATTVTTEERLCDLLEERA